MGKRTYLWTAGISTRPTTLQYISKWLFYTGEYTDICNFADDTTPHCSSNNIDEAITNLQQGVCQVREKLGNSVFPQKVREKLGNSDRSKQLSGKFLRAVNFRKSIKISNILNFERIDTTEKVKNVDWESGRTRKKSGKSQGTSGLEFGRHPVEHYCTLLVEWFHYNFLTLCALMGEGFILLTRV